MRRGLTVPEDMPLARVGQDHAKTRAWLAALEARAFEKSGRLDELRREAGVAREPKVGARSSEAVPAADRSKKEKIISRLAKKDAPTSRAKAVVAAKTRAKKR